MNISTSYRMSFEELLRATRVGNRRRRRLALLAVVLLPTDAVLLFPLGNYPVGLVALVAAGILLYQLTLGTHRAARKAMAKITGAVEVTLTDETVTIRRPGVHTEIAWQQYHRVLDTPEFLLCYLNPFTFHPVLKRGFDTAQLDRLAAFVADLTGTPATPIPPALSRSVPVRERAGGR
ncbi:YcxB family protein [Kitasatospora sp. NPDC101801]|uniref:YcxB family protein n=1 Tax=Kitasatospora sp. NPDC101801 TaxID=3364103 RepID=UPI0037F8A050